MNTIKKLTRPVATGLLLSTAALSWGCQSEMTATDGRGTRGAGIGAASGALLGGIIGSQTGSWAKGALLGAAIGGGAGALIGNYMDRQAADIRRDVQGVKVERVGEGIRVVFDSGILYSTGSSTLTAPSRSNIERLSRILNRYDDTNVVIEGHTDTIGNEYANQNLSERRAESVASLLKAYGVTGNRISTVGYGETRPVATNETESGRHLNRRVEVLIYANNDLKRQAQTGELKM
ncbi:MAG: OmpA family protein [Chlorobiaceae bacterium]|nr:OmpA family protein [Chlorobiaceae bacterium]NTW74943.1 OmpA family protein [Chlorobiaceae bacterium]